MESALSRALRGVFDDLVRLETELWNGLDARLKAEHGTTLARFEFLQVIDRVEDCRVQDVARAIGITVGGASKFVDRIEAAGECSRRPHPQDRRSSILELTDTGRRVLTETGATVDDELRARLAYVVTADELATFATTLTKLRGAHPAKENP